MRHLARLGSSKDPVFRALRQLRTAEGRSQRESFLVEQVEGVRWAQQCGCRLGPVVVSDAWLRDAPPWFEELAPQAYVASPGLLHKLFPTGKTPVVVAECGHLTRPIASLTPVDRVLVLEGIQDAGNLGSMLRTAEGLGVCDVVILQSGTTDLYNRVAVRASMGSLFRLRLYHSTLLTLRARLDELHMRLVVTTPHAQRSLGQVARDQGPLALALGNETEGVSEALLDAADERVRIPMARAVESLNVGAACAIALYALAP